MEAGHWWLATTCRASHPQHLVSGRGRVLIDAWSGITASDLRLWVSLYCSWVFYCLGLFTSSQTSPIVEPSWNRTVPSSIDFVFEIETYIVTFVTLICGDQAVCWIVNCLTGISSVYVNSPEHGSTKQVSRKKAKRKAVTVYEQYIYSVVKYDI